MNSIQQKLDEHIKKIRLEGDDKLFFMMGFMLGYSEAVMQATKLQYGDSK